MLKKKSENVRLRYCDGKDIKDLTPVRGQEGKISDTQGTDFWSPTRPIEIFPAGV